MKDVLTAEEFDAIAYQAYADQLGALKIRIMTAKSNVIKDLALQMNQEERKTLVNLFPKGKRGHGRHHDGKY